MQYKKTKCKVLDIRFLTKGTYCLKLEKPDYNFYPGQCFNLGLMDTAINREYSIYSSDKDNYVSFLIKKVEDGIVSNHLSNLKKGDEVEIDGPYGEFYLDKKLLMSELYFICTGTGIAPFHSFVNSYSDLKYTLIHGVRYEIEQYDKEQYPKERYIPCISKPEDRKHAKRVTDFIKNNDINNKANFFLCGNSKMINEVNDILTKKGINQSQIFSEVFF